jgi:hypothetical protein
MKSIGGDHQEFNTLPLPRKAKPRHNDYVVAARTKVIHPPFGTMLRPLLDVPILHYVFML